MYYIYGHYTLDSNKLFYIGKGSRKRAWYLKGRNNFWNKIVKKHGIKVKILLDNLDPKTAIKKEIEYIAKFKPRANFTLGGDGTCGYRHKKQAKLKMAVNKNKFGKDNHKSKKVLCSNGQIYYGCRDAARILKIDHSAIARVCRGEKKSYKGMIFSYGV